ncbi:putative leucine-rich repeat domain superfamily [Helianthus anomalus]
MFDLETSKELGQRGIFFPSGKNRALRYEQVGTSIWDSPHQIISFCNLAKIKITRCNSLLELFPISVAQMLVKLRYIEISNCDSLVAVISTRDEQTFGSKTELVTQDTDVVFPLTWISLRQLPKLESFYYGHSIIKYPSLENKIVEDCPSMKRWSYGENHIPKIKFEHLGKPCSNINDYIAAQLEV